MSRSEDSTGLPATAPARKPPAARANDLDGKEWTRNSISVWNDIRKTAEEQALNHPALFPAMLIERVIRCFTRADQRVILDPFSGSGSTLVTAHQLGRFGIGFDVSQEYVELARRRLSEAGAVPEEHYRLFHASARSLSDVLAANSVDLCITSPPYWDILTRKRTADNRDVRDYASGSDDLSRPSEYGEFLEGLAEVFSGVHAVLKPGAYCIVNVMDLRKQSQFFPLHSDLARRLSEGAPGFIFDDLIIWDRRAEYNYLRPLGYPAVFRINKVHEFLVILRKPKAA